MSDLDKEILLHLLRCYLKADHDDEGDFFIEQIKMITNYPITMTGKLDIKGLGEPPFNHG